MAAKQALGRGLKALLPDAPSARAGLLEVPTDRIRPNPRQPRQRFDDSDQAELAASIATHGVLQPLLVSENGDDGYILIAGERRWRAARQAGLRTVPAVVRERLDETRQLELALIENLQRRDLTPLEEARAFEHLRLDGGLSQAEIADRVGFDRSTVANALRLLKLPAEVQELVESRELSAGHARALLAFRDDGEQLAWARRAVVEALSVRAVEQAAARARQPAAAATQPTARTPRDPNLVAAEDRLARRLGTAVEIRARRRGGTILIRCDSADELLRVFDLLLEDS